MTSEQTEHRSKGSSISRVLEIIEAVSQAERALSPAELAFMLDIPKPSIHRLLQQLQADGYLQVDLRGLIVPSDRLQRIAMGVLYATRYKALRRSILQRVAKETGETCGIGIPDGINMVYYDRVQSNWPLQIHLPVGSHVPVWCSASGKLYLSSFPKVRRQQILRNLPFERSSRNTITDPQALEAALQTIGETGLGVDNEEFIDGMVACSVPICGPDGRLHACLFVHAPTLRRSLDELKAMAPILRRAANELAELLLEAHPQGGVQPL